MRRNHAPWLILLLAVVGTACGDDDGGGGDGDDGDVIDATSGVDSAGGDRDGASSDALAGTTPCPPTPDLECDSATEICVVQTPVGPGETSSCQPVPNGCEGDRTCECAGDKLCKGVFDTCSEGPAENVLVCECPQCQ